MVVQAKTHNLRRVRRARRVLVRAVLGFAAATAPTPAHAQTPEPVRAAEQFIAALAAGRWADAAAMVAPMVPPGRMEAPQLERIWGQLEAGVGKLRATQPAGAMRQDSFHIVLLSATFERQSLNLRVVLTEAAKVAGFSVVPPTPPARTPPYADTTLIRAEQVTVGQDPWKLPGTLTLPTVAGRHPAVVLVHGSGPNDRDETFGPNRPFRDLALGLTSRGVAVLRYDKRSLVHGARMASDITVEQEVIEDALAALALARAHPAVDPDRVYLLGHSLGAQLAPEIAVRDGKTAGVILLAAPARPISTLMAEQFDYLGSLPQNAAEAAQAQLRAAHATLARYRSGTLPDTAMILGAPVGYLRDLDARDPIVMARRLTAPMLVLQGDRDYQVTAADFARWRSAFENSRTVSLRSFPSLNHHFIAGSGQPNPTEYSVPAHVAREVVDVIAAWLRR